MKRFSSLALVLLVTAGCAAPSEAPVVDSSAVETDSTPQEDKAIEVPDAEASYEEAEVEAMEDLSGQEDETSDECLEGKIGNMWVLLEEENCVDPWPLTSTSGILFCDPYGEGLGVVVWNPDEDPLEYYALNGMALGQGYPDIEPFWKDNPESTGGPKVNIGPLIKAGLSLCDG